MDLLNNFRDYIKQHDLFHPKDKLLLAVSGGVDSVVLAELCQQAGFDFSIAHCNFKLRGADSDGDEAFVKDIAAKYNVPFFTKSFDTTNISAERKTSIEETARDLRYEWFGQLSPHPLKGSYSTSQIFTTNDQLQESGPSGRHKYALTAHHANDNIETVLMNFFRGTGIRGLHGILPKQKNIIRPLLFATRKDIEAFAMGNELGYRIDRSNSDNEFTRNYFRNELIPGLKKVFSAVEENITANIGRLQEAEVLYQQSIEMHKKKLLEKKGEEIHIPVLKLKKTVPLNTIVYEIISQFGFTASQTTDVTNLLDSSSGKYVLSSSHRILRNRGWLIIAPLQHEQSQTFLVGMADPAVYFPAGKLNLQILKPGNWKMDDSENIAMLDAADIKFPLLLRKWRQGDYFYPLGMKKKKKLSRFFIDQKLSLNQKENTWVIESDKKILWVVGMRIDERYKVLPSSKAVIKLELKSAGASIFPGSL